MWDSREFPLNSDFTIPTFGIALYHESKYDAGRWHFAGGVRLDYEQAQLKYYSHCDTGYQILSRQPSGVFHSYDHVDIKIDDTGDFRNSRESHTIG